MRLLLSLAALTCASGLLHASPRHRAVAARRVAVDARGRLMDELAVLDDADDESAAPVAADKSSAVLEPETLYFEGCVSGGEPPMPCHGLLG